MFKRLRNKKGFTLMEIVIAIALFSVVVAAVTPVFIGFNRDIAESKQFEMQKSVIISEFESHKKEYIESFRAGVEVFLGEGNMKVKMISFTNFTKKVKVGQDTMDIPGKNCVFQKQISTKLKVEIFISDKELTELGIAI